MKLSHSAIPTFSPALTVDGEGERDIAISAAAAYLAVVPVRFDSLPHCRVATPAAAVLQSRRLADLGQRGEKRLDRDRRDEAARADFPGIEPTRIDQSVNLRMARREDNLSFFDRVKRPSEGWSAGKWREHRRGPIKVTSDPSCMRVVSCCRNGTYATW